LLPFSGRRATESFFRQKKRIRFEWIDARLRYGDLFVHISLRLPQSPPLFSACPLNGSPSFRVFPSPPLPGLLAPLSAFRLRSKLSPDESRPPSPQQSETRIPNTSFHLPSILQSTLVGPPLFSRPPFFFSEKSSCCVLISFILRQPIGPLFLAHRRRLYAPPMILLSPL